MCLPCGTHAKFLGESLILRISDFFVFTENWPEIHPIASSRFLLVKE